MTTAVRGTAVDAALRVYPETFVGFFSVTLTFGN
jgi:hypothetical protein